MYATHTSDDLMNGLDTIQNRNDNGRLVGDEQLIVKFHRRAIISEMKSTEAGRPIFDDLVHVIILVPGDDKVRIDTGVSPEHKARFPLEWKHYEESGVVAETGTPLESWAALSPAQISEFKHFNIRTVESLAGVSDSIAQKFPGMNNLREKAKSFLKASADSAIVERQDAELAKRDVEIAELRKMIEGLAKPEKKAVKDLPA